MRQGWNKGTGLSFRQKIRGVLGMTNKPDIFKEKPVFKLKGIALPKNVDFKGMITSDLRIEAVYRRLPGTEIDYLDQFTDGLESAICILMENGRDEAGKYILSKDQIKRIDIAFVDMLQSFKEFSELEESDREGETLKWPIDFPVLIELFKALLYTGQLDAMDQVLMASAFIDSIKTICECEESEKEQIMYDIANAFVEVGDYYLFVEGEAVIAFTLYQEAARINSAYDFILTADERLDNLVDVVEAYIFFCDIYIAISNKTTLPDKEIGYLPKEALVSKNNSSILVNYLNNNMSHSDNKGELLWEETCKLYIELSDASTNLTNIVNSKDMKKALRIDLEVFYVFMDMSSIYGINNQEANIDKRLFAKLYSKAKFLSTLHFWDSKSIDEYIEKECSGNTEAFDAIFDIAVNVDMIRRQLENVPFPEELAYYTALSSIEFLLPISAKKPEYCLDKIKEAGMSPKREDDDLIPEEKYASMVGRFSLMNVGHMNDPMEGKTLLFRLLKDKKQFENRAGKSSRYVFLKSFTDRVDDIPMWVMYGNGAEGCCVVLNRDKILEDGNYNLAKVCYLREVKGEWTLLPEDNKGIDSCENIDNCLDNIRESCEMYLSYDVKGGEKQIVNLLDPILYLFKAATYCHENEYRIIENTTSRDSRICYTKERDGGRIYIPSKQRTYIEKIILGPKFKSVEDTMPYLDYRCKLLAEELDMEEIKIKVSDADFI